MKFAMLANWSIRKKLMFIIGLTVWLAMALGAIAFIAFDQRNARASLANEAMILSKVIAMRSGAAVLFGDKKTAATNLDTLRLHPAVLNACLFTHGHDLIAMFHRVQQSRYCQLIAPANLSDAFSVSRDDHIAIYAPVKVKGNQVGVIVLQVSTQGIQDRLWHFSGIALLIQMLAGLLAYWLTYRLQASVVEPIQQLREVTSKVSKSHDYSIRASQQTNDEVGDLVSGFNHMLHAIQASHFQLKEAMEELDDKREQSVALAQSSESRRQQISDYFAGASHDLKQPLNAMGLYIDELQTVYGASSDASIKKANPPLGNMLGKLSQSMENLEALLNELLDASKLEEGVKKPKLQWVCLNALCKKITQEMGVLAKDKSLSLRLHVPNDQEMRVQTDPLMLERIIRNLLSNSIRYTDQGGVMLAIRRLWNANAYSIEVWDTGVGIPIHQQESIFESHVQLNNQEQCASKGFGLGLSIVKRLTELLGYPLSLSSVEHQGTVFKLKIPGYEESENAGASVDPLKGCPVLLVDDDVDVLVAMESMFERWGVSVELADSYDSAKEYFDNLVSGNDSEHCDSEPAYPRFVITDFNLKTTLTGLDVVALAKSAMASRPFDAIVVSAESEPRIWEQLEQRNIPALRKPIKPAQLRALLVHLLKGESFIPSD